MFTRKTSRLVVLAALFLLTYSQNAIALIEEDRAEAIKIKSSEWMKTRKEADDFVKEGKLDKAETLFKKMLLERASLNLDLLSERLALAEIYEKLGKKQAADKQYKVLIEERTKLADGRKDITVASAFRPYAEFLNRSGKKKEAQALKDKIRQIEEDARSTRSDAKLAAKIAAGPESSIEKAETLRKIGASWLMNSDSRKAMVYLAKSLELNPKSAAALVDRGEAYYYDGKDSLALKDYQKAIALEPKLARAYFSKGRLLSGQNKLDLAISEYTKAIENDPKNIEYLGARGKLLDVRGKHKEAIADYSKALTLRPTSIWARVERATAYEGAKEFEKAAEDLTPLVERYPQDMDFYEYRGKAYFGGGKYEKAIADYTKVVELSPKYTGGYVGRARAYEKLEGKTSANAQKDIEQAKKFGYRP